jgi:hypothetical protein
LVLDDTSARMELVEEVVEVVVVVVEEEIEMNIVEPRKWMMMELLATLTLPLMANRELVVVSVVVVVVEVVADVVVEEEDVVEAMLQRPVTAR